MFFDSVREDYFFDIAAFVYDAFDRIAVRYAGYILLDYGAGIEVVGDVVAGGSDELDTPLKCCVIGLSTNEGRQE